MSPERDGGEAQQPNGVPVLLQWRNEKQTLVLEMWTGPGQLQELPQEAQEKMGVALGRVGQLFSFVVLTRDSLHEAGMSDERAFNFIAEYLLDMLAFFETMTADQKEIDDDAFPF